MWRRPACQTLLNALDIPSAKASEAPGLLKSLAILSNASVRRSAVHREDQSNNGNQKKGHNSLGDQQSYYLQVFQGLY